MRAIIIISVLMLTGCTRMERPDNLVLADGLSERAQAHCVHVYSKSNWHMNTASTLGMPEQRLWVDTDKKAELPLWSCFKNYQ